MIRLVYITDYMESYAYKLLRGIYRYSVESQQWVVCRMPTAYKNKLGIDGVVRWAKEWKADVVIGQFEENDNVDLFRKNGIVVIAQDFKKRFELIPNITADYNLTGRMAAEHLLEKGFRNFAFFGYKDVCWSNERCVGFRARIREAGIDSFFDPCLEQEIDNLWYYEQDRLNRWLRVIPKPIGIMACDDNQGSNLVEACNGIGIRIPSEIAVIGVDNDEIICSLTNPTLSSIYVDIEDGGYRTVALAEQMVMHPESGFHDIVLMPKKVVPRVSTAAFATEDKDIQNAVQFIHKHLDSKITVKDILEVVPLSRRLLEMRFKNVTGETLYEYISRRRVDHFAELLMESNEPVVDIAARMGEDDSKSISRRFKMLKGMTPQEWRDR